MMNSEIAAKRVGGLAAGRLAPVADAPVCRIDAHDGSTIFPPAAGAIADRLHLPSSHVLIMASPVASPSEKGSLLSFQQARSRWQKSPRKKLSPMPQTPLKSPPPTMKIPPPSVVERKLFHVDKAIHKAALSKASKEACSATEATPQSVHRDRLVAFYKKYNPAKLDTVDATLSTFSGKEDDLFQKLEAKYVKDGIPSPSGTGPTCFLEFQKQGRRVEVLLFADKAPLACDNFRALCTGESGVGRAGKPLCFRDSIIHRIVPNFCIQGGDFTKGDGTGGESIYPPNSEHGDMWGKFKDEIFMRHDRKGLLSMANNGANRNGSQFFVTLAPLPHLDGKHVVFGQVTKGMDIIEEVSKIPTDQKQRPQERVVIVDCGEIRDGKEIRESLESDQTSKVQQSAKPFAFAASSPSPFGSVSSADAKASPFTFASSTAQPLSFGASSSSSATPFSFAPQTSKSQPFAGGFSSFTNQPPSGNEANTTAPFSFKTLSLSANEPSEATTGSSKNGTLSSAEPLKNDTLSSTEPLEEPSAGCRSESETDKKSDSNDGLNATSIASKPPSAKPLLGSDDRASAKEQENDSSAPPSRKVVVASRKSVEKKDADQSSFKNPFAAINFADKVQVDTLQMSESNPFAGVTVCTPTVPTKSLQDNSMTAKSPFSFGKPQEPTNVVLHCSFWRENNGASA